MSNARTHSEFVKVSKHRHLSQLMLVIVVMLVTFSSGSGCLSSTQPRSIVSTKTIVTETALPTQQYQSMDGAAFPDATLRGTHILFMADNEKKHQEQIWAISLRDGSRKMVVEPPYPVSQCCVFFLPDGNQFVIKGKGARPENKLWISNLAGVLPVQIETPISILTDFPRYSIIWSTLANGLYPEASDYWKGWLHSPDGKKIAIWAPGQSALKIRDVESGEESAILNTQGQNGVIGIWSLDGTRFVFAFMEDDYGKTSQLFSVNSDGADLHPITKQFADSPISNLVLSPDGQQLAFWIWDRNNNWPNPSIGVLNMNTNKLKFLAAGIPKGQSLMDNGLSVWSPNSKWIAFFTLWGQKAIAVVNIDNGDIFTFMQDKDIHVEMMDWR